MKVCSLTDLFLSCMSMTYLWAFSSLYSQLPDVKKDWFYCLFVQPNILHFIKDYFNASSYISLEINCLAGILLSSLSFVFKSFRDCTVFLALWFMYYSCCQVGETFLWFQWDTLLLEAGFLTALLAPFHIFRYIISSRQGNHGLPQDYVVLFLIRWLAFRLMFASGIVKLTSECPTWWGLTALHYHFESQCLPTSMAWFAHQSPDWLKRSSVAMTYVVEILLPLLFFVPLKAVRKWTFYIQAFFMVSIMVTGNYNFFNFLYAFVCLPLLIESNDSKLGTHQLKRIFGRFLYGLGKSILSGFCLGAIVYASIHLFSFKIKPDFTLFAKLAFTKADLYLCLSWCVPLILHLATILFVLEIVCALLRCWLDHKSWFCLREMVVLASCCIMCLIASYMFAISLMPITQLDPISRQHIWPEVQSEFRRTSKYQLTHSYGLFRHMTGVGGRPELVVEGALKESGPWKEYHFLYKSGRLDKPPPFIVPHQPRLDWQMWFAALGSYQQNPWFISLVYRLLNNQPNVVKLLESNPFKNEPPVFIRAKLYHYHFTSASDTETQSRKRNWWWREEKSEYLQVVSLSSLKQFAKQQGLLAKVSPLTGPKYLQQFLKFCREWSESVQPTYFLWIFTFSMYFTRMVNAQLLGL